MGNVPKLRFIEFSGDWEKRRVDEVYSFKTTNSFSRDTLNYESGEVFNIHYGDIHTKFLTSFSLEHEHVPYINSEVQLEKIKKDNYCQVGDLVIADASEDYADIGKAIELIDLDGSDVLAGLHTILARPQRNTFALGFTGRLFQSWTVRKQIMRLSQGAKVLGLSKGYLSEVLLDYPALPEQQKIAAFLTAVDTKIEQLNKKEQLLQQYKKGVMQKIFSQEIRFKADDGSEFPEWEEKLLGDISYITTGKSNREDSSTEGQYTFFDRSEDIRTSDIYLYDAEALIIAGEGSDFPPKYFKGKFDLHQRTYAIMDFKGVFAKYLFYYIHFTRGHFVRYAVGSTVKSLRLPIFKSMPIKIPSLAEQLKISVFLTELDKQLDQTYTQLNLAKTFKKGLLQQMFV